MKDLINVMINAWCRVPYLTVVDLIWVSSPEFSLKGRGGWTNNNNMDQGPLTYFISLICHHTPVIFHDFISLCYMKIEDMSIKYAVW